MRIVSEYTAAEHRNLVKNCQQNGCENYDILFLIPPKLVTKGPNGDTSFSKMDEFREKGIEFFDGTNYKLRDLYSTRVSECRLYQYDSCRGLEGWCTVCLDLDELITYKENVYIDNPGNSLILESPEDRRHRFVYLWSLMPLTRPMDTLIITLKNPESEVGKMLKKLSIAYSDFVEWEIE